MAYRLLADLIVAVHFLWILFMFLGFILTLLGFFNRQFFERWIFRLSHLIGIAYVSALVAIGKYCPLTVWENSLRAKYDPSLTYPGSFIAHYIEKFVYPDINPFLIQGITAFIAVFTLVVFIIKPPKAIKIYLLKKARLNHD
jgi:hypothetical protein